MQFPRFVYKSASSWTLAKDQAENDALVAAGWFNSVPEAIAPKPSVVDAPSPEAPAPVVEDDEDKDASAPSLEELKQRAGELGIKFDGRTSYSALLRRIEEFSAEE